MSLCEALHGREAMARVGAPWSAKGSSLERKGKEERGHNWGRGMGWGRGQLGEEVPWGCRRSSVGAALVRSLLLLAAHEEDHVGKKGKRRERKRKGKK
jgi:hypothetical protein